jgi:hypothetical protein
MPRKGFERISREEILESLRRYVKEVEVSAGTGQGEKVTHETLLPDKPRLRWDQAWLRELLKRVRVGFAVYSSDARDAWTAEAPLPYDVLFCARHDWPGCPVPVLVAEVVLGERAFEEGRVES